MTPFIFNQAGQAMTYAAWATAFQDSETRQVAAAVIDGALVSTVWLDLDHSVGDGPPLIFETMVFGGPLDERCVRYATRDEAVAGHQRIVDELRALAAAFLAEHGHWPSWGVVDD